MAAIADYQFKEVLLEDGCTVVHRGVRRSDGTPVLIKSIKASYPTLEQIARLKHEYKILQSLDITGVIKPLALSDSQHLLISILEDFGGKPLSQIINKQPLELREFLSVAIQLAETLAQLHQAKIIHKNLKTSNILIHPVTGQVKINDFSIATQLSRENQNVSNPNLLEGTLAYLSPEQTGRMNRSIDFRSDFYSLGVIFYEMLTGCLPFQVTDPLELVHCHIAKKPPLPQQINPDIPRCVSDIVMKLMAKTAEDRYQSALGLKADLETCLHQLQSLGDVTPFQVGQLDLYSQFLIPQKLYGREEEVATLMAAFARVSSGTTEMMLVSGYSGIGKSSLVNEIHKPIVGQQGHFISGKFDQFKRNIPYAALIQAFQELIRQLLTENADKIAVWRTKLSEALGANGQAIVDVIPEVERIIGPQPAVPQLGSSEAQNRFNRVFQQFIHVFCQPAHPLVLFLDDLQWADAASLKLIQLLMSDPDSQYLLLIGAYRDNEVSATHPLILTLEEIQATGKPINNIVLQPLHLTHVSHLVSETLRCDRFRSHPLAELAYNKTQGNPFFLTQLLKSLYQDNLLYFDFHQKRWQWDIEQLQGIDITDNVVELMVSQIQKLSPTTQNVLKLAACVGNKFTLDVLSIINEKSLSETAVDLWESLQVGLVLPLSQSYKIPLVLDGETMTIGDWVLLSRGAEENFPTPDSRLPTCLGTPLPITYKFLHDRVQQAAYSLIPSSEKQQTHLKIGELLLKHTEESELEENLFEIVNQLNIGAELLTVQSRKIELAKLNLTAGKKALAATAYEPAVRYFTVGLGLLSSSWETEYDLSLELYVEATAAEFLCGNFEKAAMLADIVLLKAKTILDKVKVYETQIRFCISQNKFKEASAIDLQVLEMMGIALRETPPNALIKQSENALTIEDLDNLPPMTDPYQLAVMRILRAAGPPTYFVDAKLFTSIIFTMVDYCIQHGNSGLAAYAYACYGLILAGAMGEIDAGYQACQLALRILERYDAKEIKAEIYQIFNCHVRHFKEPLSATLEGMEIGIQSGMECGQLQYVSYIAAFYCSAILFTGCNLDIVAKKQAHYFELLVEIKTQFSIDFAAIYKQLVNNLQGESSDKIRLVGESFNETEMLANLTAANSLSLFLLYLAKGIISVLYREYTQAFENIKNAESHIQSVMGMIHVPIHNFYYSLALLALYPNVTEESEQQQYLEKVELNQIELSQLAQHAPTNFLHKYQLVEAEKARILGQHIQAMEYYDLAIEGARSEGYLHEEALAAELAAEFYFSLGRNRVARDYLTEAHHGYLRWGATAKVKDLLERYPQVFSPTYRQNNAAVEVLKTTSSADGSSLDLATVIKANQAISDEIILERLLNELMNIMIENAGARTGKLLLYQKEELVLVAEGFVEKENVIQLPGKPIETCSDLPVALLNYVARCQSAILLNDASQSGLFTDDPYIIQKRTKSILCLPIVYQSKLKAILYLENNLTKGAFTQQHLEVLNMLSSQAAISLENAILYQESQTYLERLESKNAELLQTNQSLAREIQERQQLEEERDRFFTLSLDMLVIGNVDGYFTRLNPAWEKTLGYTQEELTSKPYIEFVHPDDRAATLREGEKLAKGEQTISFENRYLCKDGSYRWLSWKVAPLGKQKLVYGVARDISDRKRSEAEREQLLAREQAARLEAEAANRIKDEFLAVLSHELRTPLGPILGWVQFLRTQKLDAVATERALETIERNAKLQTQLIEDLLDISRILQGKLTLNVSPVDLASTINESLETMRLAASAKSIQIQTFLDPSVGQVLGDSNRLQQIFWNLLSNAVKFTPHGGQVEVRLSVEAGVQGSTGVPPVGAGVQGEREKGKGKREGERGKGKGEREGEAWTVPSQESPVKSPHSPNTYYAQIQVSDTGKGITPEFLPFVFERFRQADSSTTRTYGGLGLGLAIVRHLVELHGGTVKAESQGEGKGATFTVRLPLISVRQQQQEADVYSDNSLDLAGLKILVVDDDRDMRDFTLFLLEQYGAIATAVASAAEALEIFAQFKPDVLVSDIGMPEMDGYMLLRTIRAMPPEQGGQILAIALTAYAGELNRHQANSVGFQKHLAKPVEPAQLVAAIVSLLGRDVN